MTADKKIQFRACEEHSVWSGPEGYVARQKWAQEQIMGGRMQGFCLECKRWQWPLDVTPELVWGKRPDVLAERVNELEDAISTAYKELLTITQDEDNSPKVLRRRLADAMKALSDTNACGLLAGGYDHA